jgi:hypothetical protein
LLRADTGIDAVDREGELWRTAKELVMAYGLEAEMVALHRSAILLRLGDTEEADFWWKISAAVVTFQREQARN